jgi:hypothetical protein
LFFVFCFVGGRGLSPLPTASLHTIAGMLGEWHSRHRNTSLVPSESGTTVSFLCYTLLHYLLVDPKLQEEVKKLKDIIGEQNQKISSLQQVSIQMLAFTSSHSLIF